MAKRSGQASEITPRETICAGCERATKFCSIIVGKKRRSLSRFDRDRGRLERGRSCSEQISPTIRHASRNQERSAAQGNPAYSSIAPLRYAGDGYGVSCHCAYGRITQDPALSRFSAAKSGVEICKHDFSGCHSIPVTGLGSRCCERFYRYLSARRRACQSRSRRQDHFRTSSVRCARLFSPRCTRLSSSRIGHERSSVRLLAAGSGIGGL